MHEPLPAKVLDFPSDNNFKTLLTRYFNEEVVSKSLLTYRAKSSDLNAFTRYYEGLNKNSYATQWTPVDTKGFLVSLERQGYKPASINRFFSSLKAFGSWLVEQGVVRLHPCKGIKEFRLDPLRPKSVQDHEYHKFKKVAEALGGNPRSDASQDFRNYVILEMLNASGLRIFELLGLRLDQVQGRKLVGVHCKNKKIRDILIRKDASGLLQKYIVEYRVGGSDFVFTNRYGGRLSRNGVARAFNKIAGIASATLPTEKRLVLRPHLLRHRHCFKAREAKDPVYAAKRMGHASMQYIERYSVLDDTQEEKILEEM